MRDSSAVVTGLCAVVLYATAAQAKSVEYVSPHPVPHKFGGGFCTIDVPHIHNYAPADRRMYREHKGRFYFVGDPSPFRYQGPRYAFFGAHPVAEAQIRLGHPVYCYLKGPHYHWYRPEAGATFQMSGGAYWYVGEFPPAYYDERPRYAVINEAYAPVLYTRPVVDVRVAPPALRAEIALGGPGWTAGAVVGSPAVPVPVPAVVIPSPIVPVVPIPVPVPVPPLAPVPPGISVGVSVASDMGGPPHGGDRREIIDKRHFPGRHEGRRPHPERHAPVRLEASPRRHGPEPHQPPSRLILGSAPVHQPLVGRAVPRSAIPAPNFSSPRRLSRDPGPTPPRLAAPGPAPSRESRAAPGPAAQRPAAPAPAPAQTWRGPAGPTRGPAPTPAPQPAGPTRGPAPTPPQGDHRHR